MGIHRTYTKRILTDRSRISSLVLQARKIIIDSKLLLARPVANTFLGRKSHEPFPGEQNAGRASPRWKLPQ
jgi:hypothetical protein